MPVERRATIYAVAARAEVSIATVSRVFQGSDKVASGTRDRVLTAASALDYAPDGAARSLAAKRTQVLGLVLPELKGSYYTELLNGLDAAAAELGHSVMLLLGTQQLSTRIRQLESRVDGIAVVNCSGIVEMAALDHIEQNLSLVTIGAPAPDGGVSVAAECRDIAGAITAHLLDHGRRRLRFVGDPTLSFDARHRYVGFCRAQLAAGHEATEPVRIRFEADAAEAVAEDILSGRLVADGLVCVNDEVALGLHYRLRRGGVRVGADLALTGWDDVPAARLVGPGLTTVVQPVRELGRTAAIRLVERIQGGASYGRPHTVAAHDAGRPWVVRLPRLIPPPPPPGPPTRRPLAAPGCTTTRMNRRST
jgi:LacI family transcriptional regulator